MAAMLYAFNVCLRIHDNGFFASDRLVEKNR